MKEFEAVLSQIESDFFYTSSVEEMMQLYHIDPSMQIKFDDDAAVEVLSISDDEESIEDPVHDTATGRLSLTVRRFKYKILNENIREHNVSQKSESALDLCFEYATE